MFEFLVLFVLGCIVLVLGFLAIGIKQIEKELKEMRTHLHIPEIKKEEVKGER